VNRAVNFASSEKLKIPLITVRCAKAYESLRTFVGIYPVTRELQGFTPAKYVLRGGALSCTLQKKTEEGALTVEILKDGTVVARSSTSGRMTWSRYRYGK
jgi:hypothetical protein